ncbi:MAG: PAS domain S-box protein [Candidatus Kapaibacterium sp.]
MNHYSVLIVEDERIVAKDIQTTLEKQGYRVAGIAPSGEKALELMAASLPDVVLMDIKLEGDLDGIDTADRIHALYDVPVVFLTAYSNRTIIERAKLSNQFGYVLKPFQEREIQIVIEMAVYKHQTEKKLRENKEFISAIVDSIGDGIVATNAMGEVTYMNVFAEQILGRGSRECIGKHYSDVFVLSSSDLWTADIQMKFLRDSIRSEFPAQVWLLDANNNKIPIEGSIKPMLGSIHANNGEVFAFRDITDRKSVQESLIDSEMRFRLLAEHSHDLIALIRQDGSVTYASPSFEYVLGVVNSEDGSNNFFDIVTPDDIQVLREAVEAVAAGEELQTLELLLTKSDHSTITVEAKISQIIFHKQASILIVSRDITERKKAETILAESEEKYRTMVECLNEGIIITDLEDRILFVNQKAADILDKTIDELVSNRAHEVLLPNGGYSLDYIQKLEDRKHGKSERYTEIIYDSKGRERYVEISAAPYRNAKGEVIGTVGALYDNTERLLAEQEVVSSKEKFENLVLNAPVGIIRWLVKEHRYEFANKEFERQSSMTLEEFSQLDHDQRLALIHPDDRQLATDLANSWIESGAHRPQSVQYRTFDKDGSIRWSNTYIYAERNATTSEIESITQISVDITELKATQEALSLAQQEDFRRTVKNLQNLVIKMFRRPDGELAYSLREGKLAGDLTTDQVYGKSPKTFFGDEYESKTLPNLERAFSGESVSFEAELPDGRYFYFTLEPLFENETVVEVVGSAVEITHQKLISKELHESENKYKILTDVIPIGITQISHLPSGDNIVDYVNPEFVRQSGYTLEAFIEASARQEWSFIHPEDKQETIRQLTKWHLGSRSEPFRTEYRFLRNDGQYIWLEVYLTYYDKADGTSVGIQAGVDITHKKIAHQRLQHLASFPEQIPQPIIELLADGTVTYMNPEARNYFSDIVELGFKHPVLQELAKKLHDVSDGSFGSDEMEIAHESRYFALKVYYINESNTYRVFLYDVTDRKRQETELQRTLTKERELYSLKSRFLTTVSHEFRTPLTGIQISAELLSSHAAKMDFNQRISEIDKIKDRVHDLTMLMNDFSMQSSIDSIGEYHNPTTIYLNEFAKMLTSDVDNFILGKSQTLTFAVSPQIPPIIGDERMLRKSISNIILNASKYSPKDKEIHVGIEVNDDNQIIIRISDHGIGIPHHEMKNLFTPFFRASNVGSQPGIGLGLSISKDIIEFHGGTIDVESTVNSGSVFTITLPATPKATRTL